MEKLIFFLLDHWYIIAVILAIYYQIRKGWKSATKTNPTKREGQMGMPSFGGRPGTTARPQEAPKPAEVPVQGRYAGAGQRTSQQGEQRAMTPPARRNSREAYSTVAAPVLREPSPGAPDDSLAVHRKASPFRSAARDNAIAEPESAEAAPAAREQQPLQLTPQQLAQGVAWAEILGPPRSKQPYRRR
ncbi:hypothetical protein [Paenibacillus aestuarii]|uniref:Uncharacterized protein n=1 Tax=Paenibacillus aestuarii TaxID=516965 RepID=A0ABW0KAC5_9BACL|nr:hypothetical protein [Paenibacillus aestuarii]